MTQNVLEGKPAETEDVQTSVIKRVCQHCGRVLMDVASACLTFVVLGLGAVIMLMNRPSVELNLLKPQYEDWFAEAFSGRTADIETYTARWIQDEQAVEVRAANIEITGEDGAKQDITEIRAEFSVSDNVLAKPELSKLFIDGGALTVSRDVHGLVNIGLGTPDTFERVGSLWNSQAANKDTNGNTAVNELKSITVNAAHVYILDEVEGLSLDIEDVDGHYTFDGHIIDIKSHGYIQNGGERALYDLNVQTVPDRSQLSAHFSVKDIRPINIAPKRGRFASLVNLDAPVSLDLEVESVSVTGLENLTLSLRAGQGRLKTGTTYKPFTSAQIQAAYNVPTQAVVLSDVSIESEALIVAGEGTIENIGTAMTGFLTTPIMFDLNVNTFHVNPGIRFDGPIVMDTGALQGRFDLEKRVLELDALQLDFGEFQTDFTALLERDPEGVLKTINVDGDILGTLSRERLLEFWPNDFALGARNWMVKSLKTADFTDLKLHLAMDAQDIRTGYIVDEHLTLNYNVSNVNIQYLSKMPWLRDSGGYGVLRGNQFDFQVVGGHVDGLSVEKGSVVIPRLTPKGGDLNIDFYGRGPIHEMLRVSNFEPLQYADRFGLVPDQFGGEGSIHLQITRPLLEHFDPARIRSELSGNFTGVSIPVGFGKYTLNDGTLSLHVDQEGIVVNGPIKVGHWQGLLDWGKQFGENSTPAHYTLKGKLNRDHLDGFGVGLRRHFGGEIDVVLEGDGDSLAVQATNVTADFRDADVNFGSMWNKARGEEGLLKGRLVVEAGMGGGLEDFTITARGLAVEGSVKLAKNYRLETLDLSRAFIEGLVDARLSAKPTEDGVLALNIEGAYLNISTWVDKAFKTQSSAFSAPLFITANADKMLLDENYTLNDASLLFSHTGVGVDHVKIVGETENGPFLAEITHKESTGERRAKNEKIRGGDVHVEIPDAAHAALTLLGLNSIAGGALVIDGTLPPAGEKGGVKGSAILTDFKLTRAPAFAKILSLASLQGLASTLSGSGMQFDILEMDFALDDGVLKVRDGHASGPSLGLTGEGDIGFAAQTLDFAGVLVPAYTMNSMLGDIPVLGDIIVGKKGEGMFALNYAVKGPFAATQVSVNPLSALTPGFLRRIFDVKRDKITDPEVQELIEEQKQ